MNKGMRNTLFVFEGLDGSGKSTLIKEVEKILKELGYKKIVITKQPGGCPENIALREKVCNPNKRLSRKEEEAVFWVDYCTHRHFLLNPKMKENYIILCDRHVLYSNLVYQVEDIEDMESKRKYLLEKGLDIPKATFILNTPPNICRQRTFNPREEDQSAFDKASLEVYEDRFKRYQKMLKYPETIEVDWEQSIQEQAKKIAKTILERI